MKREEIYDRLNEIFCEVFDRNDIALNDATTAGDVDGWDSLTYITIISNVEDRFSVRLPMKRVLDLKCVGELVDIIEAQTN